ncbi:MAG: rRNA maturation RNase YbeY [Lachnospiraceae bacterium]|nr:rRNA maturation RNase YbeY [Lachnospiraceae bacterium]
MTCLFECEVDLNWDFDYMKLYEAAVDATLEAEGCPYEVAVSLILTDDAQIREINHENRNIDAATDVLSFPMIDYDEPSDFSELEDDGNNFDPETGELMLGDIVLSADRVNAQAKEYGHDVSREFAFLIVHSMLHLCGYDHIEDKDRKLMEERQKIVMQSLYDDFPKLKV